MKGIITILLISIGLHAGYSQNIQWYNPETCNYSVVEGQAWPGEVAAFYDRFPARAKATLNPNVWNISHSSAGLYLKFKTNASQITVRYTVSGGFAMDHMPATGVSGVDLYALNENGIWQWLPGRFSFRDTVSYTFSNIQISRDFDGRNFEYRLYLPLYNAVKWMEIGVPLGKNFSYMPLSLDKPIVAYGTSILQGACASRPGMAWTSVLNRSTDRPLINLGFSGSGKLEKSVIDLMAEVDAKLYILDCLPNLSAGISDTELESRIVTSLDLLREKRPEVPVLFTEHSGGYKGSLADTARLNEYEHPNIVLRNTFNKLISKGYKNIYLLSNKEIDFDINSTVDGIHPNDVGMMKQADAYERSIRAILHEWKGMQTTTNPVVQCRDGYYDWCERHRAILAINKETAPESVILGNSIIHYWGGLPQAPVKRGDASWKKYLDVIGMRNMGYGWDKIENVLWRVHHDELDGYNAKRVIIMIGTNNLGDNTDKEIITGLDSLLQAVKLRQPKASVYLSGLLPRRKMESRIKELNKGIESLAKQRKIKFINPGTKLLTDKGIIEEKLFEDGLHPNADGYERLGKALKEEL